ncbi:MAG: hypothetical protein IPN70_02115 [Candidatus Moraniibacteriota bacterium]|nr:MAG: hypothetical protein IPN70_02115 [Candidatus Moranbacteria bacterium]
MEKTLQKKGEKILIITLFILSLVQFAESGTNSIHHILAKFLRVSIENFTFLDPIISSISALGSAFVLFGSILWWKSRPSSKITLLTGFTFLIFKNIFDIFNQVLLVREKYSLITEKHLSTLTNDIMANLIQIMLWVILFIYFMRKNPSIQKQTKEIEKKETPSTTE